MAATATLSAEHLSVWSELARAHSALNGRVQEALAEAGLPPVAWYELLCALADAEDQTLTMSELAEAVILSRGGLTKLFDRLARAGLAERRSCPEDRRTVNAALLPAGEAMIDEMRPVVNAELESSFAGTISEEEAAIVAAALSRVQASACSLDG